MDHGWRTLEPPMMEVPEVTRKLSRIVLGSLIVLAVSLAAACGGNQGPVRETGQTPTQGTGSATPHATSSPAATPTPELPSSSRDIGAESVWDPVQDEASLGRLHACTAPMTDCVTAIMQSSGASPQAIEFFKITRWFLSDFQEMGTVDLGRIVDPWRANDNVQYAFLNGSPLVVYPEEEVRPVAIELDPNYDALVPSFPDLSLWPGDSVFEVLGVSEREGSASCCSSAWLTAATPAGQAISPELLSISTPTAPTGVSARVPWGCVGTKGRT